MYQRLAVCVAFLIVGHVGSAVVFAGTVSEGPELVVRVIDADGKPIQGARIAMRLDEGGDPIGHPCWDRDERSIDSENFAGTNTEGRFSSMSLKARTVFLTVAAEGYSPHQMRIELDDDTQPLEIALDRGRTIAIRVVDPDGDPFPNVRFEKMSEDESKTVSAYRRKE